MASAPSEKLLECKAGKCLLDGKLVVPLAGKGYLSLWKRDDNDCLTLRWQERESSTEASSTVANIDETVSASSAVNLSPNCDEWVIVNGSKMSHVSKCKTGTIVMLEQPDEKVLFWMQDGSKDEAEVYVGAFCEAIAQFSTDQQPVESEKVKNERPPEIVVRDILNNLQQLEAAERYKSVSLTAIITKELAEKLLDKPQAVEELQRLLPEGKQDPHNVKWAFSSRPFRRTLQHLTEAIRGGQLGPAHFGLPASCDDPSISDRVLRFIRMWQEQKDNH